MSLVILVPASPQGPLQILVESDVSYAPRREDLVSRGQGGKLRPADIQGGGFTISNLGMDGVDAFNAIVDLPQAAILAVGCIADRVIAVNGQPAVQPTMMLTQLPRFWERSADISIGYAAVE